MRLTLVLASVLVASVAHAATIAPVTTSSTGTWTQNIRNNHDTICQLCVVRDGTTGTVATDNFGCVSNVQPGATIQAQGTLNSTVTTSVSVRAVAIDSAGARSAASTDNRVVSRPTAPLPLAPSLLP